MTGFWIRGYYAPVLTTFNLQIMATEKKLTNVTINGEPCSKVGLPRKDILLSFEVAPDNWMRVPLDLEIGMTVAEVQKRFQDAADGMAAYLLRHPAVQVKDTDQRDRFCSEKFCNTINFGKSSVGNIAT